MIYQKITTSTGRCLLLIRKYEDREGFELWRRKEQEFFDLRGELIDISEAEALALIQKYE